MTYRRFQKTEDGYKTSEIPPDDVRCELELDIEGGSPLAAECTDALYEGDWGSLDSAVLDYDGALEIMTVLGIHGLGLAHLWVGVNRNVDDLRLVLAAVHCGALPIHRVRDAASGLPTDLELPRLRDLAASGDLGA